MNHKTPAILATPALIYSTHWVLVAWIIVAHFHLCSLLETLSRYTMLQIWAVGRSMRLLWQEMGTVRAFHWHFGVWRLLAWCTIRPCTQYMAGAASMARAWFIHCTLASAWFIRTPLSETVATVSLSTVPVNQILLILTNLNSNTNPKLLQRISMVPSKSRTTTPEPLWTLGSHNRSPVRVILKLHWEVCRLPSKTIQVRHRTKTADRRYNDCSQTCTCAVDTSLISTVSAADHH